ncbi:MAG: glycosyltransferase family 39 protein [bacterium]|nr:glycosyltransferase family 39 protein [bacterium]
MFHQLDISLFYWINRQLNHPWLDSVMVYITQFSHFHSILLIAIFGFLVFGRRYEKTTVILLIIGVVFSDTFGNILKHIFQRIRPEHVLDNVRILVSSSSSYSFPSNHAVNMATAATMLSIRYWKQKKVAIPAIIVAFLISYSRIYVGVHYPSDILFGWVVGFISAMIVLKLLAGLDWTSRSNEKTLLGIKYSYLLTFILILITLFRLQYIQGGKLDLSAEEAQYWNWSRHLDCSYYSKGPMVAYWIYLWTKLCGNTAFAIRLGAVSIAVVLSYITYRFTERMFGNSLVAFYTVLIMNLIPLYSAGAVLMTTDILLQLFWGLTVYLLYLGITQKKSVYWYLGGICIGLGLLSKYTMGLLIPALFLFFMFSREPRYWLKRKEPYLSLLIGFIVFSPVIYWNYLHNWISFRHITELSKVTHGIKFTFGYFFEYLGSQIGILTPWFFGAMVYAWWKYWSPSLETQPMLNKVPVYWYLWCTSAPIFLTFLVKSVQGKVQANWAAPAYYTGLMLTVAVFDRKFKDAKTKQQKNLIALLTWISIILTALLVLLLHKPDYVRKLIPLKAKYDVTNRLRGWHELGEQVGQVQFEILAETNGKQVFIFSDSYQVASELAFYVPGQPETYCINLGRRMNQYDIWNGWNKLLGQNALYITDNQKQFNEKIINVFEQCYLARTVPIYREKELVREFFIYKCYNFKGLSISPPTSF